MTADDTSTIRRIVPVLGMHRSGTSMVTRMLSLLGASMIDEERLMPAHAADNPAGYWEDQAIVDLNDELLDHLGGTWDRPPRLVDGWQFDPDLDPFADRARDLLGAYPADTWSLVKDPRLCVLLPFWGRVAEMPAAVVVLRHPAQVAGSLATRDRIPSEEAAHLWIRHVVDSWRHHPDRVIVNHEFVLQDPVHCAIHLADYLSLPTPDVETLQQVRAAIRPDLHRHRDPTDTGGTAMTLATALYAVVETQPFELIDGMVEAIHDHELAKLQPAPLG